REGELGLAGRARALSTRRRLVLVVAHAPEPLEGSIEDLELFMAMDEQRPARVIHLTAFAEIEMSKRLDDVEEPARMNVDPRAAEDAAKSQHVQDDRGRSRLHYARDALFARGRSRISAAWPRIAPRSSLAFSTTPSVSSTASASSVVRLSAVSAVTQSIVSDTPGTLYRSERRSSCTMPVTWTASRVEASGARARTMSSSFSNVGYSIHWYRQRRLSASCTSRVPCDVRMTSGGSAALSVHNSGIVTWNSASSSRRNPSNSSS